MFYLIIGTFILILSFYYDFNNNKRHNYKKFWINILLIILIIIPALRYRVGGDTLSYMSEYENMPSLFNISNYKNLVESRYQPLWVLFVSILKSISPSFVLLQIAHAVIVNIIIFHVLKKYCKFIFMAIFLYYIYAYFKFNFEILREALAICTIALSIESIYQKKWWKYMLYTLIAFMLHDSAIVMFFLPFLYKRKVTFYNVIIIIVSSIMLFTGAYVYFVKIVSSGFISETIISRSIFYIESNSGFTLLGILLYLNINLLFPIFIFLIGKRNGVSTVVDGFLMFYIFIGVISTFVPGLYRLSNYQIIFAIVYLSNFFRQIKIPFPRYRIEPLHKLVIICTIFIVLSYNLIFIQLRDTSKNYPGTRYYNLYYPYYSVFNPIKYNPREVMVYDMWNL